MKVLHLPTSVGGNAWRLAQGERALGLDSTVLVSAQSWLDYPADINLHLERYLPAPGACSTFSRIKGSFAPAAKLLSTFLSIRKRYDVFHFNFGSSLLHFPLNHLNHIDLPFYPKRARLFVTYNGCDARQKFPTMQRTRVAPCHDPDCYGGQCNSGTSDIMKQKAISKMAHYVSHMWALNPDLLHFLPREKASFLPYSVRLDRVDYLPPDFDKKKLVIVHAPTDRAAKGSEHILEAVRIVKQKRDRCVEVRLVENVPHDEAMKIYRSADLVIDQVLVGWYGAFAVEAMAMGKPVVARIAPEDLHVLPGAMASEVSEAIITADPDTISDVLLTIIDNREVLKARSAAGLEYVRKWHDPVYVAGLTKAEYERA